MDFDCVVAYAITGWNFNTEQCWIIELCKQSGLKMLFLRPLINRLCYVKFFLHNIVNDFKLRFV